MCISNIQFSNNFIKNFIEMSAGKKADKAGSSKEVEEVTISDSSTTSDEEEDKGDSKQKKVIVNFKLAIKINIIL